MVLYSNKYCILSYTTKDGGTLRIDCFTNYTTFDSNLFSAVIGLGTKYFKIADDDTDISFAWSNDNVNFFEVYRVAKADGFLGPDGYNTVVFGIDANNLEVAALLEKWVEGVPPIHGG